jgi:hypothetical protein
MKFQLQHFGPIASADVELGDLTVAVGPQATGKSLLWQTLKLALDSRAIRARFERAGISWGQDRDSAVNLYFGEGMRSLVSGDTSMRLDGKSLEIDKLVRRPRGKQPADADAERVFYIPAQRVMALRSGATRPFTDFHLGDPFVLRAFGDDLHRLVQMEFASSPTLFPKKNRLKSELRDKLENALYRGFALALHTDAHSGQKQMVLTKGNTHLPVLAWSAGQREFTPLLLGLYWLMPAGAINRREAIEWVVIEEPEMGLHPRAVMAFLLLVLDLLKRGYRVALSTHSTVVLDAVWGLRTLQRHSGTVADVLRLFDLPSNPPMKELAKAVLEKSLRVLYFDPKTEGSVVTDISDLDPGSDDTAQANWGGLTAFTAAVGDVVADVVQRSFAGDTP